MHTTQADLRDGRHRRRRHSDEFKARVVAECVRPGVSIAAIALHHGLNANLLRRWVSQAGLIDAAEPCDERQVSEAPSTVLGTFVPVAISTPDEGQPSVIEVEIKRGSMQVKVSWPMAASAQCATWLRELLQ